MNNMLVIAVKLAYKTVKFRASFLFKPVTFHNPNWMKIIVVQWKPIAL